MSTTSLNELTRVVTDASIALLFTAMRKSFPCPILSQIVWIHNGRGLKAVDRQGHGTVNVFGSGGCVGRHTECMHPGPFVVIGRKGSAGKATFAAQGGWVTDTAYFATPLRADELDCKFLFYAIRSLDFSGAVISTAIPGINRTAIYGYSVPSPPLPIQVAVVNFLDALASRPLGTPLPFLPSPLAEQRRIVARIEELAGQIHEARALRQKAADEVESLHSAHLAQRMLPHGDGWTRETVVDVILSMDAGWSPQCDDVAAREGEWGVLKTTAVQWCEFWPHENKVLPPAFEPIPELTVQEGDVLVTRAGPLKRVGVVAAVRNSQPRLMLSDKIIRLRPNRKKVEPRFLELTLASPFSQKHFFYRKTGLADAQVNISQAILRSTPVAYPSLPEQRRIVAELDALQAEVDSLKRLQAETAGELDALLPSILDKAFKGEL